MGALARGQASDCGNPVLDVFTAVNGVLTDVAVLEFQVFEKVSDPGSPLQVYPVSGRQTANIAQLCPGGDKLSTGRYVAKYTPGLTELIGTHEIRWFFKLTSGSPEQTFREDFEVLPEVTGSTSFGYTTVQAMRDEGVTTAMAADSRLQTVIARVSRRIERWTGRFFEPRAMTFTLDGSGHACQQLEIPIIRIDGIWFDDFSDPASEVGLAGVRIYNRHITQNLLRPDDRENPRLEWVSDWDYIRTRSVSGTIWPPGFQNVMVQGVFGYTDYDGSEFGRTPEEIQIATQMLAFRDLKKFGDSGRADASRADRITEMRTRDQSITWSAPGSQGSSTRMLGVFSGDPAIDQIIASYVRPPSMGAV